MKKRNYKFIYKDIVFDPNAKSGMFFKGNHKKGFNSHGYINQYVPSDDGIPHTVGEHIAKWEYFNGEIPEGYEIDHINGEKTDNRLENLRCVTHCINCNNTNTKHKISDSLKGKPCPQTLKDKLKGRTPWYKGKINIYSDETIQKMRNAARINNTRRERNSKGQYL